jgi:hypothetical protein
MSKDFLFHSRLTTIFQLLKELFLNYDKKLENYRFINYLYE